MKGTNEVALSSNGDTELQPEIRTENDMTCLTSMIKFSEITSIHGINKLSDKTARFLTRRIVWLLIIVAAIILVSYQTVQSMLIYLAYKTTFSIVLDYQSPLVFPAVTICNHNSFKITTAADYGFYNYLNSLNFDSKENLNLNNETLRRINVSQMVNWNRHALDDLIKDCKFNGQPCNRSLFEMFQSDKDICYTLNNDERNTMKTRRSGSESGLSLFINVEQYEYMRSRSQAAGIKMYVHHQGFLPIRAVSIPPGMKAFVSLKHSALSLMKPPYGKCGSRELSINKRYTAQACLMECRIRQLERDCGCALSFMPDDQQDLLPECTMYEYKYCIAPKQESLLVTMDACNCDIDCETVDHHTSLSFSRISTFDTEQILSGMKGNVSQRVIKAREVFYRKNNDTKQAVEQTLNEYTKVIDLLKQAFDEARNQINIFDAFINSFQRDYKIRERMHDFILDRLVYNMRNNYVRGWQVTDERYLTPFTQGYLKLAYGLTYAFDKLTATGEEAYKWGLYATYDSKIQEYRNLTILAKKKFSSKVNKIRKLKMLSIYDTFPKEFYNSVFVHKNLIHTDFNETDKKADQAIKLMRNYYNSLREFQTILRNRVISDGKNELTRTQFDSKMKDFRKIVRQLLYRLYIYRNNTVDTALSKSLQLTQDYNDAKSDFNKYVNTLHQMLENILKFAISFERTLDRSVMKGRDIALDYLGERASLLELADFLHAPDTQKQLSQLYQELDQLTIQTMTLKEHLGTSGRVITQLMSRFFSPEVNHIYRTISNDIDCLCNNSARQCLRDNFFNDNKTRDLLKRTFDYIYEKVYGKELNYTLCDRKTKFLFNCDYAEWDVSAMVTHYQTKFSASVYFFTELNKLARLKSTLENGNQNFQQLTEKFQDEIKLSKNFITNNLIQLQIFYDSLSTTSSIEEPAYGTTQLFSDMGGNLGLCMGGSIISVIEIFDFIIVDILRKIGIK